MFQVRKACSHDVSEERVSVERFSAVLTPPLPSLEENRPDLTQTKHTFLHAVTLKAPCLLLQRATALMTILTLHWHYISISRCCQLVS